MDSSNATDFSKVTFFKHSESEIQNLQKSKIQQYLSIKISGYQRQDKIAGRQWDDQDYVTIDWIHGEWEKLDVKSCFVCGTPYAFDINEGQVKSNLTIDRLDNTKPHVIRNSQLMCLQCNVTKSNRY